MAEDNKLPLKRVEFSLTKFNEVAFPHHLGLLRQHRANILKYEELGEFARVHTEQTHARRVATQLRALLAELETLRRQVRTADLTRFDALTQRSRDHTLRAIVDYLGVIERSCRVLGEQARAQLSETSPLSINRAGGAGRDEVPVAGSAVSTESVGVVVQEEPLLQLQVDEHEAGLREREAVLRGWSDLQTEVRALHDAWRHVHAAAQQHRELVAHAACNTDTAAENVIQAREHLTFAERWKAGAYGAGGAALGALVGGPIGLVVGAKAGAAALLAGSLLGYAGATMLGRRRQMQLDEALAPAPGPAHTRDKDD